MTLTNKVDATALQHAVDLTLAEDRARAEQVQSKLANRDFEEVGTFCAYHRQSKAQRLKPWEYPPCWICVDEVDELLGTPGTERDKISGKRTAAGLLKKMLSLGISRYHPDPIRAIEAAERQRAGHD